MNANVALDRYLSQFTIAEQRAKTRELKEKLNKPSWTISDWRTGRVKIDIAWQAKINEVFGENIFANCEITNK